MGNYSNEVSGSFEKYKNDDSEKVSINPARLFKVLMSRWHWIALSLVLCLGIAYLYAKSTSPVYVSEAILQYDSKSKESKFSTNALMAGGSGASSDYLAEVYKVKSTQVLNHALDSLKAKFTFYRKQGLRNINLYPHRPFEVNILNSDIDKYGGGIFQIEKQGKSCDIRFVNKDTGVDTVYKNVGEGSVIKVPGLSFRLNSNIFTEFDKVSFTYIDYWGVKRMGERVVIKEAERNLPVLRATFSSDNAYFTKDFLSAIVSSYKQSDLISKQSASEVTLSFINEQLAAFEGLMKKSSSKLENIKSQYDLLDVGATSNQYMSTVADLRTRKLNLEIQGKNFDLVTNDIKNNKEVVANVIGWDGAPDPFLNSMLQQLNIALKDRKQNLINYSPESIVIKNLDDEIEQLKRKIIENVNLQTKKSEQAYNAYDKQLTEINKDLSRMPSAERDLIYTTSDVDVNKNIYTLLLNKKLETNIDKAGQTSSFTTIEEPVIAVRTGPNERLIILLGAAIGLAFGIAIVFMKRIFNGKFTDPGAIERQQNVSLLGIIKHNNSLRNYSEPEVLGLQTGDESFSEDINSIRTNILYQLGNRSNKLISVTSANAGEGKSFIAVSLGVALTKLNKSVVIIEADLRRPRLHKYFQATNKAGLSNYLDTDADLKSIIHASSLKGLDFITSGLVSKKPSELLHKDKFLSLLDELKNAYDYVIVDTAPVGIVSDSIPAMRHSDISIFILRWRFSTREASSIPYTLVNNYELKNVGVIVNDFKNDALYASLGDNNDMNNLYSSAYYDLSEGAKRSKWKLFSRSR